MTQLIVSCCRHNYPGTCEELLQIWSIYYFFEFIELNKSQTFFHTNTNFFFFLMKIIRDKIIIFFFTNLKKGKISNFFLASNSWDSKSPLKAAGDRSSKKSFRTEPPSDFQIGTDTLPEKSLFITYDTFIMIHLLIRTIVPPLSKNNI